MARRNGRRRGASLYDFRDLDLMHRLADEGDDEGWIETEHLARALGLGDGACGTSASGSAGCAATG